MQRRLPSLLLFSEAAFRFRHLLIRDAAYEGLLKTERRELHARVARTIGEQFPELAAAQPVLLARHWTEAAEAEPAIAAWKNAGQAALASLGCATFSR